MRWLRLLALWAIALTLAYFGPATWFEAKIEGMDPRLLSPWVPLLGVLALSAALAVTYREFAPARRTSTQRRLLVAGGGVIAGAVGIVGAFGWKLRGWLTVTAPAIRDTIVVATDPNPRSEWKESRIQRYRPLGRTGFEVSDISLGSGRITEENDGEAIARAALDRGVNYFDTAPDYSGAGSERALGKALEGRRQKVFLATKFCTPDGHLPAGSKVADYIAAVEGSLKRLRTDYVDLVHIHSCNSVERLLDPAAHEAFDRLKEQGKARFLGVSTHTPKLEIVADAAIESRRFDVMMLAYHHGAWPRLASIINRAADQGIGVVAMKTLKGAKHENLASFRNDRSAYSQAAFKWVLSNPKVACLVISFYQHQHLDEYLHASGQRPTGIELALLERYDREISGTYCRPHCGECLDSCPEELPIHDMLRYRMYEEDYGWAEEARQRYASLEKQGDVCLACPAPCMGTCPDGIAIRNRLLTTHYRLS